MAYTQKQLCKPEITDLNEIVFGMETLLSNVVRKDLSLKIELEQQRLPVCVDAGQIEQVLMNLAANARDALSKGGTLVVRTEETDQAAACSDVSWESASGRYAVLSVTDNGCGMSTETLDRMYEPYFTTKEVGKGTGLGLSISHRIVEHHHGQIEVVNGQKGARFIVSLPVVQPIGASLGPAEKEKADQGRQGIHDASGN